jgi:hypothetical protein
MANPETIPGKKSGNPLKWIGIGCGGVLFILTGLGIGLFFLGKQMFSMSEDPAAAEAAATEIMDYQVMGDTKGFMSMNIAGMKFAGVMTTDSTKPVMLAVAKVPPNLQSNNAAELQQSFEQNFVKQLEARIQVTARTNAPKQLCGQTVNMTVTEGKGFGNGQGTELPALIYQGAVNHQGNLIMVALVTAGGNVKQTADKTIAQLKCK